MLLLTKAHQFADNLPAKYEKRGLDAAKYLKGFLTGNWDGAGEERKAFSEQSGSAGAYALPLEVSAPFIDFARNASACVAAGATTHPMSGSALRVSMLSQDI